MEGSPSFSRALRPETVHPMKIVINGREYDGIDQMPPDVRQQYLQLVGSLGDADRNGVPDVLERPGSSSVEVNTSIIYNGREYKDRSELPAEVREILERMPPPQPGGTQGAGNPRAHAATATWRHSNSRRSANQSLVEQRGHLGALAVGRRVENSRLQAQFPLGPDNDSIGDDRHPAFSMALRSHAAPLVATLTRWQR